MPPPAIERTPTDEAAAIARNLLDSAAPTPSKDAPGTPPLRLAGDKHLAAKAPKCADVPTLKDLKANIPPHCFQPSLARSVSFVVRDLAIIATLYVAAYYAARTLPAAAHNFAFLPALWFLQGFMFWAVFVLGHDCGHGSFSRYPKINSAFGHVLHSAILVPFHSWRISHRKHHKNTGNYEKDEIFFPIVESDYHGKKSIITRLILEEWGFLLGLAYPIYLFKGYGHQMQNNSHLDPNSELFTDAERGMIRLSVGCWSAMLALLAALGVVFGPAFVAKYYLGPYVVFCFWLLMVTFLHHVEPGASWYNTDNWNYVKGNLQSVDRVYGVFEHFHHDIGTHVVHHLFPAIPHYHLREANAALKPYLGDLHRANSEPILPALVESYDAWRKSYRIPDNTDVFTIPRVSRAKGE